MSTLEKAIEISARAHAGQIDKGGAPYIFHPLRLMMAVKTADEQIVAVLHDVLEDSDVTVDDLRAEGFSDVIIESLLALTKHEGEDRVSAAHRAAANAIARNVKLADVRDNMDLSRIPHPSEKDHARIEQYKMVMDILLGAGAC